MFKKILSTVLAGTMLLVISGQKVSAVETEPAKTEPTKTEAKMYMNNLQHTGVCETKGVDNFTKVKWKFKTGGKIYASPITNNGVTYVGSNDNYFYAVDVNSGKELWKFETKGAVNSTAAIYDNKAFFVSGDGYIYAVNTTDGSLIWKFKTQGESTKDIWDYYLSSPAINNDTLYCGSYDGNLYALDTNNGSLKWKFKTIGDQWFPQGEIQGSPTISNGMVYFGSRDFNMYALDEKTGNGMWNSKVPLTWVSSTPATKVVNGKSMLYFGTSDLHKFNAVSALYGEQDSKRKWDIDTPFNVFGGATLVGNMAYLGCLDGRLYAVDLVNEKVVWTYQTDASKNNYSKIFDQNGEYTKEFAKITETDIDKQYEMILSLGSILSTPSVENGVIYFGSTDGYLYTVK